MATTTTDPAKAIRAEAGDLKIGDLTASRRAGPYARVEAVNDGPTSRWITLSHPGRTGTWRIPPRRTTKVWRIEGSRT